MHIAIINSFPAAAFTAETEYIKRFLEAARRTGHQAYEVVTSDDILDCNPDFVLANHEFSPKLTPHFTVGTMWGPYSYVLKDARKLRAVLSYDAYLVGSRKVGNFLDSLEAATGVHKPRSDFSFLPTALASDFPDRSDIDIRTLAYVGVHWDGLRHNELLKRLHEECLINIYGPPRSWKDYSASYRGAIPFDGEKVTLTLREHGVVLCIHKDEHRIADTPSMRMFESAAAGCVLIVDEIPFARRVLGDSVFHIDLRDPPEVNLEKIRAVLQWVAKNPAEATSMARRSHALLNRDYSIETLLHKTCDFVAQCQNDLERRDDRTRRQFALDGPDAVTRQPLIDVIVRSGSRDVSKLRRALRAIAAQTVGTYRVLLVDYKGRKDIADCAVSECTARMKIDYVRSEDTGMRSTSLWCGLNAVRAPFFAMLDDDDSIMPNHFANLLDLARQEPEHVLYYSGAVLYEEEPGHFMHPVNFSGPLGVELEERRELKFLDTFNFARICEFDNFILTNSWIARSTALDTKTLRDPGYVVAEDIYLYFMLARSGTFKLYPSATAIWHFRSTSKDNSMLGVSQTVWDNDVGKMLLRVSQERMYNGLTVAEMRQMLNLPAPKVTEPVVPQRGQAIAPLKTVAITPAHTSGVRKWGFHAPEPEGIWSAASDAGIALKMDGPHAKVQLELSFVPSGSQRGTQHVVIEVNGERFFAGAVRGWGLMTASRELSFHIPTETLVVRVRCKYLVAPANGSADVRSLGVFLSRIKYVPVSSEHAHVREIP